MCEEIKTFDVAPGVGVGKKWVNRKGWTFEYMIGFGRYLFNNDGPEATFKGGISIGKEVLNVIDNPNLISIGD